MKLILASIFGVLTAAHAQWPQTEFVVGALHDPEFTGIAAEDEKALVKFRNANFNTLSGQYSRGKGGQPVPGAFMPGSWNFFNNNDWVNIKYRLERVAAVGGLKMFVDDWDLNVWNSFDATNFQGNIDRAVANYTQAVKLPAASRAVVAGYIHADEPNPTAIRPSQSMALDIQKQLASKDPSRLAWFPLGAIWITNTGANDLAKYAAYVDAYINEPSTRVASFDYYAFNSSLNPGWIVTGCRAYGNPHEVTYFRHMGMFADRIRTARNNGRTINLWGIPNAVDHEPDGVGSARRHTPTWERMNYEAFASLAYGAKGITWFTYGRPKALVNNQETYHASPETDATIYNNIKAINLALKNMGPTLMGLNRIATVHGLDKDPASLEPGLPTLASVGALQKVLPSQTLPGNIEIGIFNNPGNKDDYILVHNKSVTAATNVTVIVNGLVYLKKHTKTSESWQKLTPVYNEAKGQTSFTLNIPAGTGELIWLGKNRRPQLVPALIRRGL